MAIRKLCRVMLVHRCLCVDRKVSGRSIAVGMMIFSILGG